MVFDSWHDLPLGGRVRAKLIGDQSPRRTALLSQQAPQQDGADITFVEAPESIEEIRDIPTRLQGTPQLVNLVVGGRTPIMGLEELNGMGFALVLYANVALQGAIYGMQAALGQLKADGCLHETGPVASFKERQRLVNKPVFDALEQRYSKPSGRTDLP